MDLGSGIRKKPIPDLGVKKGSRIRIRNTDARLFFSSDGWHFSIIENSIRNPVLGYIIFIVSL
jgi:hypothetical protein